jgi:Sec-independent protein translocase protein TatA
MAWGLTEIAIVATVIIIFFGTKPLMNWIKAYAEAKKMINDADKQEKA